MRKLKKEIYKILEVNKLEYIKDQGEFWIFSEVEKDQNFFDKLRYSTNKRNLKDFYNYLINEDLKELYNYLK